MTAHQRPPGFDFPVHHILLSNGAHRQHPTNLGALADRRAEIMFPAINLRESDGAIACAMARAFGPATGPAR